MRATGRHTDTGDERVDDNRHLKRCRQESYDTTQCFQQQHLYLNCHVAIAVPLSQLRLPVLLDFSIANGNPQTPLYVMQDQGRRRNTDAILLFSHIRDSTTSFMKRTQPCPFMPPLPFRY